MLLVQRCVRLAPRSARLFSSPIQRYTDLVQRGQLRYDGAQVLVLEHLSKLQRVLLKEHKAREKDAALQERYALERDEADDDAARRRRGGPLPRRASSEKSAPARASAATSSSAGCRCNGSGASTSTSGLNREYFLPFVDRLEDQCTVLEVVSGTDHRRLRMSSGEHAAVRYAVARDGDGTETAVDLLRGVAPEMTAIDVAPVAVARSRSVVPAALFRGADGREAAAFRFEELCGLDRGAADYGAIAERFPFLAIADVPRFSLLDHDAARRFITLVDELYERRVVAVVVARKFRRVVPDAAPSAKRRCRAGLPGLDRPSGPVAATPATFEASKWVDATDPADDDDAVDRAGTRVRARARAFRAPRAG
ncbi:ATP binding protein [Aureococcus anophagefferens]|nr:ATP binding protein [Aureococcus anophagefferens]